ncbi:hypothetical protein B0J12DRAFT_789803 [Macrophomina phaseolina]|uniref:Uncharacterized protein n=1 Tax=Macrophomina phaseolina TaxID=35725 RepID=A0ABQ8FV10_9PEZI|nr:hypothetical protein B0J12DRAFT_789803 [Macrophomina phaseolina]
MTTRQSNRKASKRATALIAAMARKPRVSKKLRLPKGTLKAQDASRTKRLAEAREAGDFLKALGFADDPIQCFNDLENSHKELVIKDLILGFCKFLYKGGANLVPADIQHYSKTGLPDADRALMRGTRLSAAGENEDEDEDEDEDMEMRSKCERNDGDKTIHGQPRWPPNVEIRGNCWRPVRMDDAGRVDLQHDPYCLRNHFTTRWGVLKDQNVSGAQHGGYTVEWDDSQWTLVAEGEHAGLWVDLSQPSYLRKTLIDLISSQLLLYRITANFGAPPYTENDVYKCAWSFTLWNCDDPTCSLEIRDYKGRPQAHFRGGKQASTEALQLFEWLTGENCPHSYDYTPCGRYP